MLPLGNGSPAAQGVSISVTAHLTEMYVAKLKLPRLNFRWLVLGCYFPDGLGLSKLLQLTTGSSIFHRDILFGWTHSMPACGLAGLIVGAIFGRRAGWSFAFAALAHTVMDLGDPLGEKLFFPFSDSKFGLGLWPWSDTGIAADLLAYYTSPVSLLVEAVCLVLAIYACKRLTGSYNPLQATIELWKRDRWLDHAPAPGGGKVGTLPMPQEQGSS